MQETIKNALMVFGRDHQAIVCIEELSELQKELTKALRGMEDTNHIAEEIADAEITIAQMKEAFDVGAEVNAWKLAKLMRLEERIRKK